MKSAFIGYLLLCIATGLLAQSKLPSPGKIELSDLLATECNFDKGAVAYKIFEWGNVYYERGSEGFSLFKQVYEKRVRIKILKDKGLSYANVTIPYYAFNNDQKIIKTEAYTYNLDDKGKVKVTEVDRSSIYTKKINKRFNELIIAFPEAKAGSVIEYKYKMEREMYWVINDWYFQDRIPTQYSEYQLSIPSLFIFSVHPVVSQIPEMKESSYDDLITTSNGVLNIKTIKKNYIMKNITGIKDEPFMGSLKDYQQRLEFQLSGVDYGNGQTKEFSNTWKDVIVDLNNDEDFGIQLSRELEALVPMLKEAVSISKEEARMKFIFNYVRSNMRWNEEEDIYSFIGLKKAWETKTGSTGDINLLLTALLKQAGFKANPILFSTRENGLVNDLYPFVTQFNLVLCFVALGDKIFILDATDKHGDYQLIPEKITNTRGFIVGETDGKWIDAIDNHKYKQMIAIHGEIDAQGIMKGNAVVISSDYAKNKRASEWRINKEAFRNNYFKTGNNIQIDELSVLNADADSLPLEQKVNFTQKLNNSGNYSYFLVNLFSGMDKNIFTADERTTDIDFGYQQEYTIFGNFTIPDTYQFEELPKDITMVLPENSVEFTRVMQIEENLLNVKITIAFKRNFYTTTDYPDFKELYKKLLTALNEQIVLKKKST